MNYHLVRTIFAGLLLLAGPSACTVDDTDPAEVRDINLIPVPAGPDSSSPRLSVGADGTTVLNWLEAAGSGHVLKFATLDDMRWQGPHTVAQGANWFANWADFPSVVPVSPTLWAAHWLVSQPAGLYAYDIYVALSSDGGQSWSEPLVPHDDGTATEHGFVSLYPSPSGVGLIWLDGRNMVNESGDDVSASGMTLRAAHLSADLILSEETLIDELICECCQTDVAMTDEGPVAVYRNRTSRETRDIYVTKYLGNRWQDGRAVANDKWKVPGCPVNGPAIDARENSVAVAWFTAAGKAHRVRVASSSDAAQSFSKPIDVVSRDTLGRVGIALLADGDIAVSWLRETAGAWAEVCVRRVSTNGRLGPVHVVSAGENVSNLSVPQMVRIDDALLFAWTGSTRRQNRVFSATLAIESL